MTRLTLSLLLVGVLAACGLFEDEHTCTCADGSPCPETGCPIPE